MKSPSFLNVAPPKCPQLGFLDKAKSLLGRWPCDHTVKTHQAPGKLHEAASKGLAQDDVPGITANMKSVMLGGCAEICKNQEGARELWQSPAELGRSAGTNLHLFLSSISVPRHLQPNPSKLPHVGPNSSFIYTPINPS